MTEDGLYRGGVTHVRHRPRRHALRYRIFMLLLDLDELPGLFGRLRWLAQGRFGLTSVHAADYGDRSGAPLKDQVQARLAAAGVDAQGPVRLLTMPRILGHGFNPLSLYFCHHADGTLAATLCEVTNTFGERHTYVLPSSRETGVQRHEAPKRFYVSPFMDMEMRYRFVMQPPAERVRIVIDVEDGTGPTLTAAFVGRREALTDRSLLAAWLTHPLLSLTVVFGIHWEALKLLLKGLKVRRRPACPHQGFTVGTPHRTA